VNKKTTRKQQYNETMTNLYLAFELGAPKWKLAFSTGLGQKPRLRNIEARDMVSLEKEISAAKKRFHLPADTAVVSCYEAGRDGFWLHRHLTSMGIENSVVDSSSIEVNRRKRRAKTDRLDAEKLAQMLIRYHFLGDRKVWSVVCAPSPEAEDRRQMHRERYALKKEIDRAMNRIRGLLATQGIRISGAMNLTDERLKSIRLWDGSCLPARLRNRLKREWAHVMFLKNQLAALEKERRDEMKQAEEPDVEKIKTLQILRGIGDVGSWVIVREFFGWRKFKNRKEVGSLAGYTGTPYDSGTGKREQGISKAGNRYIRRVMVELSWSWIRFQPDSVLTQWFNERFAEGGKKARKVGIVAVARKLLIALWRFLEWGVIPDGAELKATA
jgi:transposase